MTHKQINKQGKRHVGNVVCEFVSLFKLSTLRNTFYPEYKYLYIYIYTFFFNLQSDASVCSDIRGSSILLCRPANLKRPVTDTFCCLTCPLLIHTLIFFN